jgi:GTP-binding protein
VLDILPTDGSDPLVNYQTIRTELGRYSETLAAKPEIILVNKTDLDPENKALYNFQRRLGKEVYPVSAVTGQGLSEVNERLWQMLQTTRETS